ncbi:hypothetical protein EN962_31730 [Mesorhizobium sp. M7A.F.Ca.CA.001.09.2.1]|nr:hypothetical protein [Mesorhizobium sp. WSM1293]AMY00840.1 hypothetical protein A4R29_16110 [Mesorhizobium ciceri biovar biserrulae]RUY66902.1 hypothetical protein EN962_31730 [Mesorhizobium sp. M7A.F.Ca.CA.001.09.2.1]RVA04571.1 hypothetical protein EN938_12360 [Mesorhizobium sp. M7A.F.Ca.US.001.02.1.1]
MIRIHPWRQHRAVATSTQGSALGTCLPAKNIFVAPLEGKKHDYQIVFRRGFGSTYWRRSDAATAS